MTPEEDVWGYFLTDEELNSARPRSSKNLKPLYFDLETRYQGTDHPFSTEAKKHHEVFSAQYTGEGVRSLDLVNPSNFLAGGNLAKSEEAKILERFNVLAKSGDRVFVGWNTAEFDLPVLRNRFALHGTGSISGIRHVDLMVEARKAFRELGINRPFSLRSFSEDLIEASTQGMSETEKSSYLGRWNITSAGKQRIRLPNGEVLSGADYWKALGNEGSLSELKKYAMTDVDLLKFIDDHSNFTAHALDPSVPLNKQLLQNMKRYEKVDAAARFWGSEISRVRNTYRDWEFETGKEAIKLQMSSDESIGSSQFAKWMREGRGGFKAGDVAWLVYDEELSKKLNFERPVVGAQISYRGTEYRFDFRSPGQKDAYSELTERIAVEMGDTAALADMKKKKAEGLLKFKASLKERQAKEAVEHVSATKSVGIHEKARPAGLDDVVSEAVHDVGKVEKAFSLSRVAPYAVGITMGVDLLASREKTGPFWGLVAAGATALGTSSIVMTKKMATLPRVAAIGAAYAITRMIAGSLSKEGPLPGFEEQGEASIMRKQLTAFGSKFDGLRSIVRTLGKDLEGWLEGGAARKLFRPVVTGEGKAIGAGGAGSISLHQLERIGAEAPINVVKKTYNVEAFGGFEQAVAAMEAEAAALGTGAKNFMPTVYKTGIHNDVPYMIMEHIPGVTLQKHLATGGQVTGQHLSEVGSSAASLHRSKMYHSDIRDVNILIGQEGAYKGHAFLIDPTPGRYGWWNFGHESAQINFGQSQDLVALETLGKYQTAPASSFGSVREALTSISNAPTLRYIQENFPEQATVMAASGAYEGYTPTKLKHFSTLVAKRAGLSGASFEAEELWAEATDASIAKARSLSASSQMGIQSYNQAKESSVDSLYRKSHPQNLEGFQDIGIAGAARKQGTGFGSGYDAFKGVGRAMADILGITEKGAAMYERLAKNDEFVSALIRFNPLEELGHGGMGRATKGEITLRGQQFPIVMKESLSKESAWALKEEVEQLRRGQLGQAAAVYHSEEGAYFMEFVEGQTVKNLVESGGQIRPKDVKAIEKTLAETGMVHGDLSPRNMIASPNAGVVMIDPAPLEKFDVAFSRPLDLEERFALGKASDEVQLKLLGGLAKKKDQLQHLDWFSQHLMDTTNAPAYASMSGESINKVIASQLEAGQPTLSRYRANRSKRYLQVISRKAKVHASGAIPPSSGFVPEASELSPRRSRKVQQTHNLSSSRLKSSMSPKKGSQSMTSAQGGSVQEFVDDVTMMEQ